MKAGFSRRFLRFERAGGRSGTGQKNGWSELVSTRASVDKKAMREKNNSQSETALNILVFRVRYQILLSDLSVRDRIVDIKSGEVMNIISVDNVADKSRELEVVASVIQ